jgi:hypothetical protein
MKSGDYMQSIKYGDVVKVSGYDNGREATIVDIKSDEEVLVQMGTKTLHVNPNTITVMSRALQDRDGNCIELGLSVGDKVRYTYPNPPADVEKEQLIKYGEIVSFVSKKLVNVRWVGQDVDKTERIARLKWVPVIPVWFIKSQGGK